MNTEGDSLVSATKRSDEALRKFYIVTMILTSHYRIPACVVDGLISAVRRLEEAALRRGRVLESVESTERTVETDEASEPSE